jgi:hypothetical protein
MGVGLALSLIAVGGASISWAAMHMWSITAPSAAGDRSAQFTATRPQNGQSTEARATGDDMALLGAEMVGLPAALERVTEERDQARQELMELQDRWSW